MNSTILDNPIWHALDGDQSHFGSGDVDVRWFDVEVAPFAGLREFTPLNFRKLFNSIAEDRAAVIFSVDSDLDFSPFKLVTKVSGYQLIYQGIPASASGMAKLTKLTDQHVQKMLELTALTEPGPFLPRTIEFGNYIGILDNDQLVAMAGQRLQCAGFSEISAVCTDPNHTGKGYARILIDEQIRMIQADQKTPYLHVRADNTRALGLYQRMGFSIRSEIHFYVLHKG